MALSTDTGRYRNQGAPACAPAGLISLAVAGSPVLHETAHGFLPGIWDLAGSLAAARGPGNLAKLMLLVLFCAISASKEEGLEASGPGRRATLATSFADNLRLLCSYKASISEVCRDLSINRSQFNRYLAGRAAPRPGLMRRICDYFGLELHEALLPATDFEALIRVRGVPESGPGRALDQHLDRILGMGDGRVLELQGMYFEHHYSMAVPGTILRALLVFETQGGLMAYRRLERIGPPDRVCRRHYRYQGIALMLGDRIFLSDYECSLRLELSQTVLFPDYAHRAATFLGVKLGVAANRQRAPCSARVLLQRAPAGSTWLGNLRHCGIFPEDSDAIPDEIRTAIDNRTSGPHHFLAQGAG